MAAMAGHEWTPLLAIAARRASRSVLRGVGSARQSQPFDVLKAIDVLGQEGAVTLAAGAPMGFKNLVIIGTFFIMREVELAFAKVSHVKFCLINLKCTLLLPVSKKDPRAIGCERSWSCLCKDAALRRADCPFHAMRDQVDLLERIFGIDNLARLPLFPDASGAVADKAAVVAALEATVSAYGDLTIGPFGARLYGGHSFRVTGAQRLAAAGVEIIKIMVLARWASEVVLRYVKDAPLVGLSEQVKTLEDKKDLAKLLEKAADGAENLNTKMSDIEGRLQKLIVEQETWASDREVANSQLGLPPFVTNGRTKKLKLHRSSVDGMEFPPYLWRAKCGFRFAFSGFTRHWTVQDFDVKTLCGTCFGQEVNIDDGNSSAESAEVESSSESSSGSSASCGGAPAAVRRNFPVAPPSIVDEVSEVSD